MNLLHALDEQGIGEEKYPQYNLMVPPAVTALSAH